jgi:hypothetical protein
MTAEDCPAPDKTSYEFFPFMEILVHQTSGSSTLWDMLERFKAMLMSQEPVLVL